MSWCFSDVNSSECWIACSHFQSDRCGSTDSASSLNRRCIGSEITKVEHIHQIAYCRRVCWHVGVCGGRNWVGQIVPRGRGTRFPRFAYAEEQFAAHSHKGL